MKDHRSRIGVQIPVSPETAEDQRMLYALLKREADRIGRARGLHVGEMTSIEKLTLRGQILCRAEFAARRPTRGVPR